MGIYRGPNIVRDSLLLYVDAGSHRSYTDPATTWYDLTSNGYNGTKVGIITYNSTFPQNYETDEDAGNWDFQDFEELNLTDCTFNLWFKTDSLVADQVLMSKGSFATTDPLTVWYDVDVSGGEIGSGNSHTIDVVVYDGSVTHRISAPTDTINSTTHIYCLDIVIKPSTDTLAIYVDGDLKVSNTTSYNGLQNTTAIYKLGASTSSGYTIDGRIYSNKIYTRALTATEILQNYNAQKTRFGL